MTCRARNSDHISFVAVKSIYKLYNSVPLRMSGDGDDRRLFLGLKLLSILFFLGGVGGGEGRKIWQALFWVA